MTVVDRVQYNLLMNRFAGTNRGQAEPIDSWIKRAKLACYSCGSCSIGGIVKPLGWLCPSCLSQHRKEALCEVPM
jgi:hypothetical protein